MGKLMNRRLIDGDKLHSWAAETQAKWPTALRRRRRTAALWWWRQCVRTSVTWPEQWREINNAFAAASATAP